MQKLKNAILDKLIQNHVTDAELSVLLYVSRFQTERGNVVGVYYKEVAEELGIAYQTFYNALHGLEEKQIIMQQKGSYYDIDVLILDNDFRSMQDAMKEGFINTGAEMFLDAAFQRLKANEKLIAMYIFKVAKSGRGSYHIGKENFYDKFTKLLGVSRRMLQQYLTSLRKLFYIGIKEGKYWITPRRRASEGRKWTEKERYEESIVKTVFRRNRAKYEKKDFTDIKEVVHQYYDQYKGQLGSAIGRAIQKSLFLRNTGKNPYKWDRQIYPAYVHKLLREELNIMG